MFLQKLRNETAECHLALEKNPYSVALMSPSVTIENYLNYLTKLYGFVSGFEKNVFPSLIDVDPDIENRRKTHWMEQDILVLGGDLTKIPVMPAEVFSKHYTHEAVALGGLYVLEGSMLGGNIIKKHLSEKLNDSVIDKMRYLTAYGAETGKVWKNFLTLLTHHASDKNKEDAIIKSAVITFRFIDEWLTSEIKLN